MNIMDGMDGMDAARYNSANPDDKTKEKKAEEDRKGMPAQVLRNLNNK